MIALQVDCNVIKDSNLKLCKQLRAKLKTSTSSNSSGNQSESNSLAADNTGRPKHILRFSYVQLNKTGMGTTSLKYQETYLDVSRHDVVMHF